MFQLDSGLCDGLWHVVMVEHNSLEVMLALDIETVVTRSLRNINSDSEGEFVANKPKV